MWVLGVAANEWSCKYMERFAETDVSVEEIREGYIYGRLSERELDPDPFKQFGHWFQEAHDAGVHLPDACPAGWWGRRSTRRGDHQHESLVCVDSTGVAWSSTPIMRVKKHARSSATHTLRWSSTGKSKAGKYASRARRRR